MSIWRGYRHTRSARYSILVTSFPRRSYHHPPQPPWVHAPEYNQAADIYKQQDATGAHAQQSRQSQGGARSTLRGKRVMKWQKNVATSSTTNSGRPFMSWLAPKPLARSREIVPGEGEGTSGGAPVSRSKGRDQRNEETNVEAATTDHEQPSCAFTVAYVRQRQVSCKHGVYVILHSKRVERKIALIPNWEKGRNLQLEHTGGLTYHWLQLSHTCTAAGMDTPPVSVTRQGSGKTARQTWRSRRPISTAGVGGGGRRE
jgi:hypothetical protein